MIFAAADKSDRYHSDGVKHLEELGKRVILADSGLIEFDIVLKSRGFDGEERRQEWRRLVEEFPRAGTAIKPVGPTTLYIAAGLEAGYGLGYFDSLVAAEALEFDGEVVSSDRDFDRIPGLRRIPLEED